ncbi:MAG: bifunctional diaminohydroxyphosphoribosylaminopyrimidine deaminase/5-amino-6-(5-phosphoribosylamino)uracil reductase RibD [Bdellovibrionales bacterium]|nr:bifunctional diaminohydroxyphosphoribosylaminopyrimidine deaminase/5-amino-6-(5-phosphoribosylamino)uracil reductase RibD [Bdellovibrionales bacterium]
MVFSPKQAMKFALQEAKKGIGWVEPNPPVGCVILDSDYHFLSSGYHEKYGMAHAEVNALKKIRDKEKLKGAHVFVTLEPCHHKGKTPPCSKTLAHYSIKSLTYGVEDPFTKTGGLDYLRQKGVTIIRSPDLQKELENLVAPFKFSFSNQKSFVSLKVASSLDGVVALENGKSQWITGEKAREHSHFLRASHSATLIGVNTFLKDNPRLNIRIDPFKDKKNKVIILDPEGKSFSLLPKSHLLNTHSPNQVIVCCFDNTKPHWEKNSISNLGVKTLFFKSYLSGTKDTKERKYFSLSALLKHFYQKEKIQSVLVEGGAFCLSQFLKEKVAQKLYLYMSPQIIGMGLRWSRDFTIQKLSDSCLLNSMTVQPIGNDFLIEGVFYTLTLK